MYCENMNLCFGEMVSALHNGDNLILVTHCTLDRTEEIAPYEIIREGAPCKSVYSLVGKSGL